MRASTLLNNLLAPLGIRLTAARNPDTDLHLYHELFPAGSVQKRRFYNIGAGSFRHRYWTNVDLPSQWYHADKPDSVDVAWDMSAGVPVGIDSGVAEIVYCSHTIEHLLDSHNRHFFAEAFRILKPGGVLRITCPDLQLIHEGLRRRQSALIPNDEPGFSLQDRFLCFFVSQLSDLMRHTNPQGASQIRIPDAEVDRIFSTLPFDEACNHFTAMCDYSLSRLAPGAHINWWTYDKIARFMAEAGFTAIRRSGYGQSLCPVLRNTHYFDSTIPEFSVYAEAEKPA